jgi:hypothetical protein
MERRIAITTAATVALTVLAGGTAIAANVGILGGQPASGLGETSSITVASTTSTTPEPEVRTIVVDETVPAPAVTAPRATVPGTAPSATSDDQGDDGDDDDVYEDHDSDDDHDESDDRDESDDHDDDHEDEHEFEGADDDD